MSAQAIRLPGYGAAELKACATRSMAAGATGSALLVGVDGRVLRVVVLNGMPVLNEAAVQAARQYVFKPALAAGRTVAVPFRFRLNCR
jgi:TonB family protein